MRISSTLAAAAVAAAVLIPGSGSPAAATSCAPPTGMSPRALVTGAPLWNDGNGPTYLSDPDRFAVVGTVVGVSTDAEDKYGRTEVEVRVDALFGSAPPTSDPSRIVVTESDPGLMNGYGFKKGTRYFIPLLHEGPDGMTNYSFVCDPIGRVGGAQRLVTAARKSGVVDVVVPGRTPRAVPVADDGELAQTVAPSPAGSSAEPVGTVLTGLLAGACFVAGGLWLRRSRYGREHGAGPA